VFGGAGAIWGFSEAVGLRVPSTVWFWRPAALTFGAIFFARWILQVQDYVAEENVRFFPKAAPAGGNAEEQISLARQGENVYT